MRTVTYRTVLEGALRMRGQDPTAAAVAAKMAMAEYLNQALSDCHEFWRWPELMTTEQRRYRASWRAQRYAAKTEIWDDATQGYYSATVAVLATDVPGVSVNWVKLTQFHRYIDYVQPKQTPIEAVIGAWDRDPRSDREALPIYYTLRDEGVRFAPDAPDTVWIEFRRRCPDYRWSSIYQVAAYGAETIVYDETTGEVYLASADCAATDTPGDVSTPWMKLDVPYIFRHAAKLKAYAAWCQANGETETAIAYDNNDTGNPGKFQTALEDQVWQYTKLQGQTGQISRLNT